MQEANPSMYRFDGHNNIVQIARDSVEDEPMDGNNQNDDSIIQDDNQDYNSGGHELSSDGNSSGGEELNFTGHSSSGSE